MPIKIGEVEALYRCPVKSMMGERLDVADVGWHGLDGDRRLAFRRIGDRGGFPWLTASRLPELILFAPKRRGPAIDRAPVTNREIYRAIGADRFEIRTEVSLDKGASWKPGRYSLVATRTKT